MNCYLKGKLSGFSLIEVLITLVLLAVGVLGAIALQTKGISYAKDTEGRDVAIGLVDELTAIMRAYPEELFNKQPPLYPMFMGLREESLLYQTQGEGFAYIESCNENSTKVQAVLGCWQQRVEEVLPGAKELAKQYFYICRSSEVGECDGKGSAIEIQIAWKTAKEGACVSSIDNKSEACTYLSRVEL